MTPKISVVIVSFNASNYLRECLHTLASGVRSSIEVIVVDNASTDGSPEMVETEFPSVLLVRSSENLGFGKANNIGIKMAKGSYIALVNSDVHVYEGCLDALVDFLERTPTAGMVGPRLTYGDARLQSSCRHFPSIWNNTCEVMCLNRTFPMSQRFTGEHMFHSRYDTEMKVDVLVGCFILARASVLASLHGFDEDFFFYGEDIDLSQRCWNAGFEVWFIPTAHAIHYCGGSSSGAPLKYQLAQQDARLLYWSKHYTVFHVFVLRCIMSLRCVLGLSYFALKGMLSRGMVPSPKQVPSYHWHCLVGIWFRRRPSLV